MLRQTEERTRPDGRAERDISRDVVCVQRYMRGGTTTDYLASKTITGASQGMSAMMWFNELQLGTHSP